MYLKLVRISDNGIQSQGILTLFDQKDNTLFQCDTLELTYDNNKRRISCIPTGTYQVLPNYSFRFGRGFKLINVKSRDGILIHCGNFNSDTQGCILVGNGYRDMNDDFQLDLLNSRVTMKALLAILKDPTTINISYEWN